MSTDLGESGCFVVVHVVYGVLYVSINTAEIWYNCGRSGCSASTGPVYHNSKIVANDISMSCAYEALKIN